MKACSTCASASPTAWLRSTTGRIRSARPRQLESLPANGAVFRQLVGLVSLNHPLGAKAPVVSQRLGAVHLRIEREFLVPRPRVEVAELLVFYLVHLGEDFDAHEVRVAVVGGNVVADDVT